MATMPATPEIICPPDGSVIVLEGVPWGVYEALRDARENYHVRMAYDDGRLELMSPSFGHELDSRRLAKLVFAVVSGLGLRMVDAGSTTLRRQGEGTLAGQGKEPDSCFYLANEPRMRGKRTFDPTVDPPPDLAIEVEVSRRSESSLKIYAKMGVPEVWRYDGRKLWIGRLRKNGTYARCEVSPALPILTPEIILHWLSRIDELGEVAWVHELSEWASKQPLPRDGGRKK